MSKHTPNPCICGQRPDIVGMAAKQVKCIYCQRSGPARATKEWAVNHWDEQTAAPDLLEALKELREAAREYVDIVSTLNIDDDGGVDILFAFNLVSARERLEKALAAAEVLFNPVAKAEPKP